MMRIETKTLARPAALSESAAEELRRAIVEGAFSLGAPLREGQLTTLLGISKTPIREALSLLSTEGLVVSYPQRGFFVFSLTREDIRQLLVYRHAMEEVALSMALAQARAQLIDDLTGICTDMKDAHDRGDFHRYLILDGAFHDALFRRAGNSYLSASYRLASGKIATIRTHLSRGHQRTDLSLAEHTSILDALANGKDDAAKAILKAQIFRGIEAYSELISDKDTADD